MAFAIGFLALATALSPWIYRLSKDHTGWILGLFPLSLFGYGVFLSKDVISGGPLKSSWEWAPSLNIQFSTYFDSLSLLFFLLITGIGSLVLVYGGAYLKGHPQLGKFYPLLLLFMTSMVGVVVSDNLLVLFVFWELTSISSYLLIGFSHEDEEARKSALRALTITGSGGLALLAGIILLGWVGGSYQISDLITLFGVIRVSPLYIPILLLIFIGAFTKSAQFPFHFWLPGAMVAPTPVSSYLHSATMVKAGFFLLVRLSPVLGATDTWHFTLIGFGSVTMLFGALMAVAQTDLKKLLAYSTISALGLLFLLIGINTELSVKAAILFLVIHSLYKGALFMIAGIIDHETHTRDVTALEGLFRVMPLVAIAAGLAAFSMSGLPPLLGFIGKELIYEAKVQAPGIFLWVLPLTILANALTVAIAFIVGVRPFWGKVSIHFEKGHRLSWGLWIGPVVLAVFSLLLGIFPGLINTLSNAAATAVRAEVTVVKLSLWHGLNPVLMMSMGTLILGVILFAIRERLRVVRQSAQVYTKWGPKRLYEKGFNAILEFAKYTTDLLQNGSLRFYISTIMSVVVVALGLTLIRVNGWYPISTDFGEATILEWAIAITIVLASIMVVTHPSRLVCAIATGVIGYSIALVFILYSAPDLAITQILVETLTVILFVSVVYYLPRYGSLLKTRTKWMHVLLSAAFGIIMTLLTLKATNFQLQETISVYFTENSLSQAFGRNVVNVILVDFRALDTLGEIVVLSVAAIGIFALLSWVGRKKGVS